MKAGDLRYRVTIQRLAETGRNTANEPITEPVDVATVWAAVEPLRGREYWQAQTVQAESVYRIRIRYRAGIDHTMQVKWGERVFKLISPPINVGERNVELQLMCSEVQPNG